MTFLINPIDTRSNDCTEKIDLGMGYYKLEEFWGNLWAVWYFFFLPYFSEFL